VLEHYLSELKAPATGFGFTKAMPVHYYREGLPPGETSPVAFHLVFATRHMKGLYVMNNCMVRSLYALYDEEYAGTFFPEFRKDADLRQAKEIIAREIPQQFMSRPFTINQVKQQFMQHTDVLIMEGDYRKIVLALRDTGLLEKIDSGVPSNDRTRFRIAPP